jgi:mannose-6-phosphate isomerase-like protein (cupin superfamily)
MDLNRKKVSIQEAMSLLPGPAGERYATMMQHGGVEIEFYAPRGADPQQPHTRDEIYFVMHGRGVFWDGETRAQFMPGDVIYVPAGTPHRFEDFSDDLALWAVFYRG